MKNSFLACLLCCIGISVAQVKLFGKCPTVDVVPNFNVTGVSIDIFLGISIRPHKMDFSSKLVKILKNKSKDTLLPIL
jgi:hypothetical protein